jgi:hypothetical protein
MLISYKITLTALFPPRTAAARWPAARYLSDWPQPLWPAAFATALHPFFESLLPLDADARVAATAAAYDTLRRWAWELAGACRVLVRMPVANAVRAKVSIRLRGVVAYMLI